jgi:SAM-dependent methyltransferase
MAAQAPDWSAGHYETTAAELLPAAERLVALAAPEPGERVLDLGTGTGNAALLAARRGAHATGVDSAARLIEVARGRAAAEGLDAQFEIGDLLAPPVPAGSFDIALSAFGVIFAVDPARAVDAIARALHPEGRALLAAWVPEGPISAMVGVLARAAAEASGNEPPARFPWHDADAVAELARPFGAATSSHEERLRISGPSPREYFELVERDHPLSLAGRGLLENAGTYDATRERAVAVLEEANEDPGAFLVHSPYRVIELRDFRVAG